MANFCPAKEEGKMQAAMRGNTLVCACAHQDVCGGRNGRIRTFGFFVLTFFLWNFGRNLSQFSFFSSSSFASSLLIISACSRRVKWKKKIIKIVLGSNIGNHRFRSSGEHLGGGRKECEGAEENFASRP
jgi:hypothetical protein